MSPKEELTSEQVRSLIGKTGEKRATRWKAGWHEIGTKRNYYRSKWESNYGRYLEFLRTQGEIRNWEHEPTTFWFDAIKRGVRSYLPDFRVTRNDGTQYYVEVKGFMDAKSKTKLKRMKKYHPEIELEVVDKDRYRVLAKTAKAIVPGWESN